MSNITSLRPPFYQATFKQVEEQLAQSAISSRACHYLYRQLFQVGPESLRRNPHIAERTIDALNKYYNLYLPKILTTQSASDGTIKFLLELEDHQRVEAVLLPFYKRYTICLSSQVGCRMACSFCYTATAGFIRHLSASEIIGQYLVLYWWARANRGQYGQIKPNIVFMGQGEALDNFDALKLAIDVMLQSTGIHLGPGQMTLSSCGLLPAMKRLNELPAVNFALSLHSPFDEVRSQLIPINRRYPLCEVFEYLQQHPLSTRQFITFEYMVIPGINNRPSDIDELVRLISPLKALVNLIGFNPFPGCQYQAPTMNDLEVFKQKLVEKQIRVMIRSTKGDEILAACGQLRSK